MVYYLFNTIRLLHHIMACIQIILATELNFFHCALMVLQIHDVADIFVTLFKFYSEFEKRNILIFYFNVLNMEVIWFYTRLYLYPIRVIFPSWFNYRGTEIYEW